MPLSHLVCWVSLWLVLNSVRSEPVRSGVRRAHQDDHRHLYVARPRGSESWSPELVQDFVLLNYDRANGEVLGYQRSSGKVFAQHSAANPRLMTEALSLTDAVLIGLRKGTAGLHALDTELCEVLAADAESALPGWRRLTPELLNDRDSTPWSTHILASDPPWSLTWQAESQSVSGKRRVLLSSNGDHGLSCECHWTQTAGLWRAVRGASHSERCEPTRKSIHDEEHTGPETELRHEAQGPSALRSLMRLKAQKFCREVQARLFDRVLLFVPATELVGTKASAQDCWAVASKYFGKKHVPNSISYGPHRVRLPRAQVLNDIKFGIQTLSIVQSIVSAISLDIETEASMSAYAVASNLPFARKLYLLAVPGQGTQSFPQLEKQLHEMSDIVNTSRFHQTPLPLTVARVCDPDVKRIPQYKLLAQLLVSQTASVTPESANTTAVSQAFVAYCAQTIRCLTPAMDAYESYARCSSGDEFETHVKGSSRFSKSLKQMSQMTKQVYTGASDATPMDLADQAVDKSMQVIEELIFKTQELSELYVQGVQAQQAQMLRVPRSNTSQMYHTRWLAFAAKARAWCCATHPNHSVLDMNPKGCVNEIERNLWRFYDT